MKSDNNKVSNPRFKAIFIGVVLIWSLLILTLAGWDYWGSYYATLETARSAARESYSKDLVYRQWVTMLGGLYAPVTPETPPNPYLLHIPERDISTPSGKKLTLINPAYMNRQVYALGEKEYGVLGHITSLRPIRPENAPDKWERMALQAFAGGQKEVGSLETIRNATYFRLMRPLITETGCLKCHEAQGYKVGDIRGGISVSIPWAPFHKALGAQLHVVILAYGVIWVIGIIGLYIGKNRLHNYLSDRNQAWNTLRRSEADLKEAQRVGQLGSWDWDATTDTITWSEEYYHIFSFDPTLRPPGYEEHLKVYTPESAARLDAAVKRNMQTGEAYALDLELARKEEPHHWITARSETKRDAQGKIIGLRGTAQDITERKQAENERRNLEERLIRAEKMESLGKMAGGVAHDMNNVLGVLMAYSELLVEKIPADNPLRVYAVNILKSSEKGAAIIQDMLTLARRGVMVSEVVDFNRVVSNLLATPEFDTLKGYHSQVTVKTALEKDLLNIKGSHFHLEKMLMNLVSNAAEAISGSGEVNIQTENRYLDRPVRGYDKVEEGDYVVLRVSDNGNGIPAADLDKIFEPFYSKKKLGRSGTGLGLAIVWGTVKDHEGYIDVQSVEGSGTTFTLYFPVTRETMSGDVQKIPIEQYIGHGESVLVVDDVQEQRHVATTLLMRLGYRVNTVSSGEEAVEYLKSNKTDILVLDMIMDPGIDGLETYKRIVEINPHQKAIIVSGFSETDQVREAQKLGAGAYVKKPYVMEKLGVAIRGELDRK